MVTHSLRAYVSDHKEEDRAVLKIDFSNAFNKVDRTTFLAEAHKKFPRFKVDQVVLRKGVGLTLQPRVRDQFQFRSPAGTGPTPVRPRSPDRRDRGFGPGPQPAVHG